MDRSFCRSVVTIGPGEWHAYVEDEWRDAIVVLEHGEIELHCTLAMRHFAQGTVLWLDGLGVRALHNPGSVDAVLVATSRRRPALRAPDP